MNRRSSPHERNHDGVRLMRSKPLAALAACAFVRW